jgi:hypothetical protein
VNLLARIGSALFIPALVSASPASAQQKTPRAISGEDIYEKVVASVVKIAVFAKDGSPLKTGSGVVISPAGDVVTNFHVVDGGTFFELSRSGKRAPVSTPARPVSCAKQQDLALLRAASFEGLQPAKASFELPRVGSRVFALGAPLSLESTFADGIVSQIRRDGPRLLIQTTAPISHGSSGGGLFSETGDLFGITTEFMAGGQALNFAVSTQGLNELRPCSRFGEAALTTPTKSVGKFVTYEGVRLSLGLTKESVLKRLDDRVTLEPGESSEARQSFNLRKRSTTLHLGYVVFEGGTLSEASQGFNFGDSQFSLAAILYRALREMTPGSELSARIWFAESKDIKAWTIGIAGADGDVEIHLIDTPEGRSVGVEKRIRPD